MSHNKCIFILRAKLKKKQNKKPGHMPKAIKTNRDKCNTRQLLVLINELPSDMLDCEQSDGYLIQLKLAFHIPLFP